MARILLTCTANDGTVPYARGDYKRLLRLSRRDRVGNHTLVDDPESADCIVFVGSSEPFYRDIRTSELYRKYREKCVLIDSGDFGIPFIPGIYIDLTLPWALFTSGSTKSGVYFRVSENDSLEIDGSVSTARYLYSYVGNVKSHLIRERLLDLGDDRALIKDTSHDSVFQSDGTTGVNRERGLFYRSVIANSKFVLCPRGKSVSSWRLFETMRSGRVPVILSDDWIEPEGPNWQEFSVRIPEREISSIPQILRGMETEAPCMAASARKAWMAHYDEAVIFDLVCSQCVDVLAKHKRRNFCRHALVYLKALTPWHIRYWFVGPTLRKIVG